MRTALALLLVACKGQSTAPPVTSSAPPTPAASSTPLPSATAAPSAAAGGSGVTAFGFDKDPAGPPAGFRSGRTGQGREGKWVVRPESDAPSAPNVVAQMDADTTDYRFPVLFA